jgi:hypothetical protein
LDGLIEIFYNFGVFEFPVLIVPGAVVVHPENGLLFGDNILFSCPGHGRSLRLKFKVFLYLKTKTDTSGKHL